MAAVVPGPGQSQSIIYGYHADGSLATRDWSRTDGANRLRMTWLYSNAGKLATTHYGPAAIQSFAPGHTLYTPSVQYTYDPAGRITTRTDGTGTTLMTWRFDGSPLMEEAVDGLGSPLAAGRHLRRTYDASGRLTGLESSWGSLLSGVNTSGSGTVSPAVSSLSGCLRLTCSPLADCRGVCQGQIGFSCQALRLFRVASWP